METNREQQGVQALETGLDVLDALAAFPHPMMLKDIAAKAEMHPAKVHRYLVSLVRKGYAEQDSSGLYRLGTNALRVGLSCLLQLDAVRLVMPWLDRLSEQLDESVLAAVWGNVGPTVVQWRNSDRPVNVNVRPGSVMPMLSSATGKVFTAFLDADTAAPLVAAELAQRNPRAAEDFPRSMADVERMCEDIRRDGIGTVAGELREGINSIGAPVFNHEGKLVMAIVALGSEKTFDVRRDGPIADAVRQTAAAFSRELGYGAL